MSEVEVPTTTAPLTTVIDRWAVDYYDELRARGPVWDDASQAFLIMAPELAEEVARER